MNVSRFYPIFFLACRVAEQLTRLPIGNTLGRESHELLGYPPPPPPPRLTTKNYVLPPSSWDKMFHDVRGNCVAALVL